jgi:hypothetical protein
VPHAPELPDPALRGRLADAKSPSKEDVSALSALVRLDQPLPQFDRMTSAMSRLDQTPIADATMINSAEQWG